MLNTSTLNSYAPATIPETPIMTVMDAGSLRLAMATPLIAEDNLDLPLAIVEVVPPIVEVELESTHYTNTKMEYKDHDDLMDTTEAKKYRIQK